MGWKRLGIGAAGAVLVVATTACEPAPTPWDVELVSVNAAGTGPGNGFSGPAVWSADGSVVAFSSTSNDLVPGDDMDDAAEDVYVRDLETGVTTRESPHPASDFSCCTAVDALSADGTKLLFHSTRDDLTSLPDTNGGYDYFLRDLDAEATTVVSVNASGTATGNGPSPGHFAFMTPDGSQVAFTSMAYDLVPGGSEPGNPGLFMRDLAAGTTTFVAGNVQWPQGLSADGTKVLFSTWVPLAPDDGNGISDDLYLRDLAAGTTTLVSVNADGTGAGDRGASFGSLTPDGERVLFTSLSDNLVTEGFDANGLNDVFLRDLTTETTRLVSTDASGTASGEGSSSDGVLSPDGSMVVYSTDTSVDSFDPNELNLYAKDLATGRLTLVTPRTPDDAGGTGGLAPIGFTGDGRAFVFTSDAANFGPVDENGRTDVYARDLVSETTHLVSAGPDGKRAALGEVSHAAVSPVDRRIAFVSTALSNTQVFGARLPLADVALTGSIEARGGPLTYEFTVTNRGPDDVEGVVLAIALPEGTALSGATATAGTCEESQPRVVLCTFGDTGAGVIADVTVTATVQAPPGTTLEAVALAASQTYEADTDDNVVRLTSSAG
jgi:uncharacterized repeat protein (TIGR01451 family)